MKTIIIGFSYNKKSILSKFIRVVTKSNVSHTYVRIPVPEYNTNMIFQASGLITNYCSAEVFSKKSVIVEEYEVLVSDEQWNYAEKFRVTQSGKPYSIAQLFGGLLVIIARTFGKTISNPFANGLRSYVCVEIVTDMIGLSGGENMTPEDLRQWCEHNAKIIQ